MTITRKIFLLFLIIIVILISSSILLYQLRASFLENTSWVIHTHEVNTSIESLGSLIKDAETGQRGYLLTDNNSYLDPYHKSIESIHKEFIKLKNFTLDNQKQQTKLSELEPLISKKMSELESTISLHNNGDEDKAHEIVKSNLGKNLMDQIRVVLDDMKKKEAELLAIRQAQFQENLEKTFLAIVFGSVLLIIIVGIITYVAVRNINKNITEHIDSENKLKHLATHDALTNLNNRIGFEKEINYEIDRATRYKHQLSIIMIDLDNFKTINDTYGHNCGDIVLKDIGHILANSKRKVDYVLRYGGEEFLLVIPETSLNETRDFAERLRLKIASYIFKIGNDKEINVTASMGIANFPNHATTFSELLNAADVAMYQAKNDGRNRVVTYQG